MASRYVKDLERKVQSMETLLLQLLPDGDLGSRFTRTRRRIDSDDITTEIESKYLQDPDRAFMEYLVEWHRDPIQGRPFFGKSSSAQLAGTAINLKYEYSGKTYSPAPFVCRKRPEFWDLIEPLDHHDQVTYTFPEDDLLQSLVNLYFERVNILLPLLHRLTFENSISEKLHLKDQKFAEVVIFVCAVASRYSDDPRVLFEGQQSAQSSGWKWVHQVVSTLRLPIHTSTLYDLQFLCLFAQFILGSSAHYLCWTLVGIGLRVAQDVGVHQRRGRDSPNTVEGELWKRAFWCLLFMDRVASSHLGRPCALYGEEIDVEPPVECDDQYWIHANPEEAFKQPAGQPSDISYFNTSLRLSHLLEFCLRTLYLMQKSKKSFGVLRPDWDRQVAVELDASLDKWFDSVPEHLKWDPNQENATHFNQSAALYILYFHLRILIHRPFINSPIKLTPSHILPLHICTNAARSCSRVIDTHRIRGHMYPISGFGTFNVGLVLLFNIWYQKHLDHSFDVSHDIDLVHKCMKTLEGLCARWHFGGSSWSILYEIASEEDLPVPDSIPPSVDTWDGGHGFGLLTNTSSPSSGSLTDPFLSTSWFTECQIEPPSDVLLDGDITTGWFGRQVDNFGRSYPMTMSDSTSQWMDMIDLRNRIPSGLDISHLHDSSE
ncbi:fungal-specific transcription factor domain-containing protein [Armillaria novae-zelandiae]|uniref:Fungal-specific transcription factor domain-containing protein n=1 Tax=Armillaria novae-zelandiae TaxID=153914 RepID=A0AA39P1X3_9AGAR|nr:fungal-specific transcription factor domain-containing protein [Armillaria novae-zelandiae]